MSTCETRMILRTQKKHGWITIADIASANCLFDFVGRRNHRAFLNSTSHRPSGKSTWGSLLWDGTSRNYLRGLLQMRCLTQSNLRISAIDSVKIRLLQFIDAIVIENEHSLDIHSLFDFEEIFKNWILYCCFNMSSKRDLVHFLIMLNSDII